VLGGVATEFSGPDASADLMALAAVQQQLRNLDLIFDKWRTRLQEEITQLDPWREQLRSDAGFLREAANPPKPGPGALPVDQLPDALRSRLRDLAGEIETTREPLRKRLDVVVAADVRVGKLQTALSELQGQLDATRLGRQQQPLAVTAAPLWKLPASLRPPLALTRQNLVTLRVGIVDYLKARPAEVTTFVLILGVLLVSVARLRRSILAKGETGADALLTHYPFAVTLLVWTLVGPFLLLRDLPLGLSLLRGLIGIILLWRILPSLVTPLEIRPVKSLMLLGIAWLTKLIVLGDAWYGRLLAVVLGFLALLAFRELARRSTVEPGGRALFRRAIHGVAVVAPAIVAVGLIAEVVGARSLGQQAIGGIVFVLLALCALLAADAILRSIIDAWVGGPGARWSRGVRNWPEAVRTWGRRGTRLLLFIAFLNLLPGILPVLEPLWNAVGRLLTTAVTLGSLQLSLGDVLWFFIGISLALAVARLVRFVLDEDVLPRMPLSLGAASASSRLIYYALVVLGIVFALAASGVELSKLTLVISALGVGIGFGLQNIVNNFVSGLVLAFERPVREGDQVTLGQPGGQTSGRVDLIGLRATRIRTPDGAEVIVPNAMLISSEVTNWTLSDRARRIEIPVGVGADSDPGRIQALLLEAVAGQPGVAERPAPVAAFRGIGASSLDFSLYLWTDDIDDRLAVESEARGRVLAAIRTAGIEIPFPRVDLRVRDGVPPDATR
jgi:small-conductance mechanosensitive channel